MRAVSWTVVPFSQACGTSIHFHKARAVIPFIGRLNGLISYRDIEPGLPLLPEFHNPDTSLNDPSRGARWYLAVSRVPRSSESPGDERSGRTRGVGAGVVRGWRDKETRRRLVTQMRPACFIAPLPDHGRVDAETVALLLLPDP